MGDEENLELHLGLRSTKSIIRLTESLETIEGRVLSSIHVLIRAN